MTRKEPITHNYSKNEVLAAIILRYGNVDKCCEVLDISKSTFSRNMKKLTDAWVQRLMGIGADIKSIYNLNQHGGEDMHQYGSVKKIINNGTVESVILAFNNIIAKKDLEITELKKRLSEYEKSI